MRIKIIPDPVERQRARFVCGDSPWPIKYERQMAAVAGTWLDVETEHLFQDQFNTGPIEGVSANGLRVNVRDVEEIEDDARIGVVKCSWCYGYSEDGDTCAKCGRSDHLSPLRPIGPCGLIE